MSLRTHVLIHGYALEASGWDMTVWGNPPHHLGRLPRGIVAALDRIADRVIIGSGLRNSKGQIECEITRDMLLARLANLPDFDALHGRDPASLASWLLPRLHLDDQSQTTAEEINHAACNLMAEGGGRLVIVSSPFHLPRCLKEAVLWRERNSVDPNRLMIEAVVSDASLPDINIGNVAILEPPHRPDRDATPLHTVAARLLTVPVSRRAELLRELDRLLNTYTK